MNTKITDQLMNAISWLGAIVGMIQSVLAVQEEKYVATIFSVSLSLAFVLIILVFNCNKKKYVDLYSVSSSMALNNRLHSLRELVLIKHREINGDDGKYKIKRADFGYTLSQSKKRANFYDIHYLISFDLLKPKLLPQFIVNHSRNRTFRFFIITLAAHPEEFSGKIYFSNDSEPQMVECVKKDCITKGKSGSNEKLYSGVYEIITVIPLNIAKERQIRIEFEYDIKGQISKDQRKHSFTIIPRNYSRKIRTLNVAVQGKDVKIENLELQRYGINGEFEIPELFYPPDPRKENIQKYSVTVAPIMLSVFGAI